jgi:Oxaloacetate decarboxylase, gamma chain.
MSDSPAMIMLVNMTIVFSVLMLLWGLITLTGMVADQLNKGE